MGKKLNDEYNLEDSFPSLYYQTQLECDLGEQDVQTSAIGVKDTLSPLKTSKDKSEAVKRNP